MQQESFYHDRYTLESKDGKYYIYDTDKRLLFYAEVAQTPFPTNEITLYSDEQKDKALIRIKTTQNLSYYKTFTITNLSDSKTLGYARLSSFKSVFMDRWEILSSEKKEIGYIEEKSMLLSMLRYMISMRIPQKFHVVLEGKKVLFFEQIFHPSLIKMQLYFPSESKNKVDRKLAIAYALLCTINTKHGDVAGYSPSAGN